MVATAANNNGPRPAPRHIYSYVAQPNLYSDHYPDKENTPEGVISIAFSRSTIRSIHTNNDAVRGVVLVKSNIKVDSVSIQFTGRSTCRALEGANQHVLSTDLFRHELALQRIARPSQNCPSNKVEYPFEFRFPEAVQLSAFTPCDVDPKFETEPSHPLPPSLWWNESTVRNEYVLEAQCVSKEKHFTMNPKVIYQLRFFPSVPEVGLRDQVVLVPAPPMRIEQRLKASDVGSGIETLRRLSRRLSSSATISVDPSSTSLLILRVPEHYRAGSKSALKVSLQIASQQSDAISTAVTYLRGIRAQAIARIDYRIPLPSHPSLAYNILRSGESTFDLFNRRYATPGLPLSTTTTTDIETFEINRLVPPTFKTYNVALSYDVKYDLLLECDGKESEQEVLVKDVKIEPMTREGGWLGPPPEDGTCEDGEVLTDLMRGSRQITSGDGPRRGSVDPPAYEP